MLKALVVRWLRVLMNLIFVAPFVVVFFFFFVWVNRNRDRAPRIVDTAMACRRSAVILARNGATFVVGSSSRRLRSGASSSSSYIGAVWEAVFGTECGNGELFLQRSFSSQSWKRLSVRLRDLPTRYTKDLRGHLLGQIWVQNLQRFIKIRTDRGVPREEETGDMDAEL